MASTASAIGAGKEDCPLGYSTPSTIHRRLAISGIEFTRDNSRAPTLRFSSMRQVIAFRPIIASSSGRLRHHFESKQTATPLREQAETERILATGGLPASQFRDRRDAERTLATGFAGFGQHLEQGDIRRQRPPVAPDTRRRRICGRRRYDSDV